MFEFGPHVRVLVCRNVKRKEQFGAPLGGGAE